MQILGRVIKSNGENASHAKENRTNVEITQDVLCGAVLPRRAMFVQKAARERHTNGEDASTRWQRRRLASLAHPVPPPVQRIDGNPRYNRPIVVPKTKRKEKKRKECKQAHEEEEEEQQQVCEAAIKEDPSRRTFYSTWSSHDVGHSDIQRISRNIAQRENALRELSPRIRRRRFRYALLARQTAPRLRPDRLV